jgi:hypothetical protein
MAYDHTEYNGGAPSRNMPDRPSTLLELAIWMNKLSKSVGAGVHHWVTEGKMHYLMLNSDGDIGQRGLL